MPRSEKSIRIDCFSHSCTTTSSLAGSTSATRAWPCPAARWPPRPVPPRRCPPGRAPHGAPTVRRCLPGDQPCRTLASPRPPARLRTDGRAQRSPTRANAPWAAPRRCARGRHRSPVEVAGLTSMPPSGRTRRPWPRRRPSDRRARDPQVEAALGQRAGSRKPPDAGQVAEALAVALRWPTTCASSPSAATPAPAPVRAPSGRRADARPGGTRPARRRRRRSPPGRRPGWNAWTASARPRRRRCRLEHRSWWAVPGELGVTLVGEDRHARARAPGRLGAEIAQTACRVGWRVRPQTRARAASSGSTASRSRPPARPGAAGTATARHPASSAPMA